MKSHPEQHISINLEASDLASETLPTLLSTLLNRSHPLRRKSRFELTESRCASPDPENQRATVARYRNADIQFILMTLAPAIPALVTYKIWMWDVLKIDKLLSMR
ncbi:hypothetical protein KCP71_25165 [Salmonella enterica subsp. enterica]|nr:hypothetical protein KCP71_25165 [Salmonella enterica subsp. enterica]